jgi:hypothetical protein
MTDPRDKRDGDPSGPGRRGGLRGRGHDEKVIVSDLLSLDGVHARPGRPEEDRRDGFKHSGWQMPYLDVAASDMSVPVTVVSVDEKN